MLIKWTFVFDNNHLAVDVRDEAEDKRISECVESFIDLICIPSVGKNAYVNLKLCRAIVREEVNEEAQPAAPETQTLQDPAVEGEEKAPQA